MNGTLLAIVSVFSGGRIELRLKTSHPPTNLFFMYDSAAGGYFFAFRIPRSSAMGACELF